MKRTLSLVLALVMVLGMIPVYAQAATPQEEAGKLLEQLGVLKGDQNGNLMLDKTLLRRDAVVMLARLLGEEEVAEKYPTAPTWKDVTIKYYEPFLGWAQAEGYYKGYNDAKFGFTDEITVQDYAQVLLRALGYTDVEWKDAYTKAKDLGLLEGVTLEATAKLPRGNMSVMTVTALNTKVKDSEKTLAETLEIEMPAEFAMTAKATGAKKITVTFNKAVDKTKAVIEVTRGTVKPSVKSVTWADDNKSAVVEFNTNMVAGDYTVKVTGLTDEALTATLKVEAAKLTSVEIKGDVLVISNAPTNTQVKAGVVALNQYGEEISGFSGNVSSSKGTGSIVSGQLVLNVTSGTFVVGETVVVTIVDPQTGVIATKTMKVAQGAQVAEIKIGELKTDDTTLAAKPINVTNLNNNLSKYYVPVEIKDQYGNLLKANELTGVNIYTSNAQILNPKGFKDLADGRTVIELQTATGTASSGTVVLTVVAQTTGKTASATINVLPDAKIDVVTVGSPDTELKINKATTLPVTVIDTYGNEIALKDVQIVGSGSTQLKLNGNTTISVTNATLTTKTNYTTGVVTIQITPSASPISVIVVTGTGKTQTLTLTAVAQPVPASIKGMSADFVSMLANDTTMNTKIVGNVVFLDQYGEEIEVGTTADANGYKYEVAKKSGTSTSMAADVISATATAGSDVYTVKLFKSAEVLDEMDVTITVVDKAAITSFGIEDLNKFYTGGADTKYNQQVKIYGLVNGNKVAVPQSMIKLVTATNGLEISGTGLYTAKVINTSGADVKSTITVLVEAGTNSYTLTKEVVYSDATPKAQSLTAKSNGVTVEGAVELSIATPGSVSIDLTTSSALKFVAADQYGVAKTSGFSFAVTGSNKVTVSGNTLTATGLAAGDSFVVHAFIDGLNKQITVYAK
ncbi:hypothetical protein E4100_02390 [Soehngenia longivitae]|uniref:SLH domain-containing protein n=1 Tax=Soehngenia longivitae TaxID=2562294 RepID=A0A4Z0D991_9FIRM|nr:hypothetical protein [Soehngenia longivitae]TFZ41447.1 hypothetical protein E4100_02390 [Soehngenia longivitae]